MGKTITLPSWLADEVLAGGHGKVIGSEVGFNERADVVMAADGTNLNDFWNEINETIRIRNADRSRLIDALTYRVTSPIEQVTLPGGEVEFEEASEYGQPVGIRAGATRLFRGYDFKFWDLAVRYTWMFIAEANQAQLRQQHNLALEADTKLIFNKVMKTLFNSVNVNGITDQNEPITVFKLYNGDGEVPPDYKFNTFAGSHSHYMVSGAATVTSANLDSLYTNIAEHGFTFEAGYKLVLWVNQQEANVIKTFKTATGASFDFVPNPAYFGGAIWVPNNGTYVGGPSGTVENEIGTYGPWHVVQENYIPAGYMAGIATGGPNNLANPIGIREHSNPAYRGLKIIPGQRSDYPLMDSFYRRGIGAGIRQRGGAAIMQIKVPGAYDIPVQYA